MCCNAYWLHCWGEEWFTTSILQGQQENDIVFGKFFDRKTRSTMTKNKKPHAHVLRNFRGKDLPRTITFFEVHNCFTRCNGFDTSFGLSMSLLPKIFFFSCTWKIPTFQRLDKWCFKRANEKRHKHSMRQCVCEGKGLVLLHWLQECLVQYLSCLSDERADILSRVSYRLPV